MKTLLIAYHSQTGNTQKLVEAAYAAAQQSTENLHIICKSARQVTVSQVQTADAYIFATPENFGYMSGELKALFDRTYENCREQTAGKHYALLISCGNDGGGAVTAIQRILTGYNMKDSGLCLIASGEITENSIKQAEEIGQYMAVALENGIL